MTNHVDFQADCEQCFGLCCTALAFAASTQFALDKDSGVPCSNLRTDYLCGIHKNLRQQGYKGCTIYDCNGAGQKVSQITFKGTSWRDAPASAELMFHVFPIVEQLQEMLLYLHQSIALETTKSIHQEIQAAIEETERLTLLEPKAIVEIDVPAYRANINELLLQTSELVRNAAYMKHTISPKKQKSYKRGANLIGAQLSHADLRGANLRGAYLIAADLRNADLRDSDLIGADLRDADLRGADLTGAIFLTQSQINAAKGDARTKLPPSLTPPSYWITS
ncbi:pentapeptide repeat-containing protein [Paenibacillus albiflavus]|uniref:Pentapeptide repeat-containing protein n=1 Tax=Paenibacillus albiflavus TaxID=2545760 RepID=A0A4R4EJC0_9BACL|nr:pentapeptide repeat-containing protein [Paenibacillus albiflavus]TCZ80049.1 pentapeptide repeat-containing protein [Paenibacillus albiflavus]